MGVSFVSDLNRKVENGEYKELIQLSEALHEKKIAEIADMITRRKKRIVLIAGPSSSGKTTFARRLCIQLKVNGLNPLYLGTDDYFVERTNTQRLTYEKDEFLRCWIGKDTTEESTGVALMLEPGEKFGKVKDRLMPTISQIRPSSSLYTSYRR